MSDPGSDPVPESDRPPAEPTASPQSDQARFNGADQGGSSTQWLTAEQAADRLGVRPQTLYSYVSRGLLTSHPVPGVRASRYDRAEVELLADRSRARGPRRTGVEVVVDTELTLLDPAGRLYYRGWDVTEAARTATYEQVADWLWTGRSPEPGAAEWQARPEVLIAVRRALSGLPTSVSVVDRMRVATAVAAIADPLRHDLRPEAVAAVGRSLVSTLVDSFGPTARPGSIAARLWPTLCPRPPQPGELEVINTALVLLADHELAASTLGARVAASTWADPYLVVQTGLGVLGGPLHGGASRMVVSLLSQAVGGGRSPAEVLGEQLRAGGIPGLGHSVYRGADPRAKVLFSAVEKVAGKTTAWAAIAQLLALVTERGLPFPNVDMALGAATVCLRLEPDAGEAIFAVARIAGWLAHAIEEYPHRLRYRPRAVYLGPPPRD